MAKKKKRLPLRERRRREKIRKGIRRYHRDVKAVKRATGLSWRESQRLIPQSVRRPPGRKSKRPIPRADLLDVARERAAVTRESEYVPEIEKPESIEGKSVEITYIDLLEYLIQAARENGPVEIATEFYELDKEVLEAGPRASEIYRDFGRAGDNFYAPAEKKRQASDREWRLGMRFTLVFGLKGWALLQ